MRVLSNTPEEPLRVLRRMLLAGEHQKTGDSLVDENGVPIALMELWMGAGLGGVCGAGRAECLEEAGLGTVSKAKGGISSGVMTEIALATHNARYLVPFYAGLLSEEKLIEKVSQIKERPKHRKGKLNLKEDVIDPVRKLLGDDAVHHAPTGLYAVVTESPSGKGKLIDLKNVRNPYSWIDVTHASMAVPGIFPPVDLGGTLCVDGVASLPIPLIEAVRIVRPTDMLIIASRPLPEEIGWMESSLFWWYTQVMLYGAPPAIRRGMTKIDERTLRALRKMTLLRKANINCLAIFPSAASALFPIHVPMLNLLNPKLIEDVGARGKSQLEGLLEDARKQCVKSDIMRFI